MGKTIAVLGGGWGGLTAAHALKGLLSNEHRIVIIEKKESFTFYPSFIRVIVGEKPDLKYVESPLKNLIRKDLEIIQENIIAVDAANKIVTTDKQKLTCDYIIIATGAELFPETISGFNENALNLYDTKGAFQIYDELKTMNKGKIALVISATPFRCPPAPYEAAMMASWFLKERGVRKDVEISIYTPEKFPMPSAGAAVGELFKEILKKHNINFFPEHSVSKIESNKIIHFKSGTTADYDLLIGVPPHGVSKAIKDSGLTDASGYIPTHPQTMEILDVADELTTKYPGVFAIGDVAGIKLLNEKYLPKGGVFAEEEAHTVARNIAAAIKNEKANASFNGKGVCYVDVGEGMAAEGSGDFYAYPEPVVTLEIPTIESRRAKHEFERVFEWWFTEYQNK